MRNQEPLLRSQEHAGLCLCSWPHDFSIQHGYVKWQSLAVSTAALRLNRARCNTVIKILLRTHIAHGHLLRYMCGHVPRALAPLQMALVWFTIDQCSPVLNSRYSEHQKALNGMRKSRSVIWLHWARGLLFTAGRSVKISFAFLYHFVHLISELYGTNCWVLLQLQASDSFSEQV